jgi:hypothetical protein
LERHGALRPDLLYDDLAPARDVNVLQLRYVIEAAA